MTTTRTILTKGSKSTSTIHTPTPWCQTNTIVVLLLRRDDWLLLFVAAAPTRRRFLFSCTGRTTAYTYVLFNSRCAVQIRRSSSSRGGRLRLWFAFFLSLRPNRRRTKTKSVSSRAVSKLLHPLLTVSSYTNNYSYLTFSVDLFYGFSFNCYKIPLGTPRLILFVVETAIEYPSQRPAPPRLTKQPPISKEYSSCWNYHRSFLCWSIPFPGPWKRGQSSWGL